MAAQDIAYEIVTDFLALGAKFVVVEGPNLQRAPDNMSEIHTPGASFLQADCTRRKVSGTIKCYEIDDGAVLPASGEPWAIAGAAAAPYTVIIDAVNDEGQTEGGHAASSIQFHYFEATTAKTTTAADMTTAPV